MPDDAALAAILLGLTLYVVLDGQSLGVGILSLFDQDAGHRAEMRRHVSFAWDANESWLLLPAVGLFAAFPGVYSVVLPALYLPLAGMLFSFIARGVSIELLAENTPGRRVLDRAFELGSLGAVVFQGLAAGALLSGISVENGQFDGGAFDWVSGYSILTAVAAVALQALAGAAWIYHRNVAEELRDTSLRWVRRALPVTVGLLVLAWVALPSAASRGAHGATRGPVIAVAAACGLVAVAAIAATVLRPDPRRRWVPFAAVTLLKVAGLAGVVALVWPTLVPGAIDYGDAAADSSSVWFFVVAAFLTLPMVFVYNAFGYSVFGRRKKPASEVAAGE